MGLTYFIPMGLVASLAIAPWMLTPAWADSHRFMAEIESMQTPTDEIPWWVRLFKRTEVAAKEVSRVGDAAKPYCLLGDRYVPNPGYGGEGPKAPPAKPESKLTLGTASENIQRSVAEWLNDNLDLSRLNTSPKVPIQVFVTTYKKEETPIAQWNQTSKPIIHVNLSDLDYAQLQSRDAVVVREKIKQALSKSKAYDWSFKFMRTWQEPATK